FDLLGKCMWAAQSSIDVTKWKAEPSDDPHTAAQMVCWLAPLYIAYKAGVASESMLKKFNDGNVAQMKKLNSQILSEPSYANAKHFEKSSKATTGPGTPGEIVFFSCNINRSNQELAKSSIHYALLVTGNCVASLWNVPNNYNKIQLCSIPTLVEEIKKDTKEP